ncbi:hypothetical protein HDU85_003478 [Gaertneriomyces sp. JEL0708]|nr:hypothetical protein HDU85_003478 [Gaertneriomyces sp. JEL0708]
MAAEPNYSVHAMLGALALAFAPQVFRTGLILRQTGYNNVNPRNQWDSLKQRMTKSSYEMVMRANGAHANGIEAFTFFSAAILAANYAKLPVETLNTSSLYFLIARALYNVVYIVNVTPAMSAARSLVWFGGLGISIKLMWAAANALVSKP